VLAAQLVEHSHDPERVQRLAIDGDAVAFLEILKDVPAADRRATKFGK